MWFFSRSSDVNNETKQWNNDVRPSYESVLWRFRTLKNIREGNVPKLRKVKFEKKLEIIPVSYKKGTSEMYEGCPSPSKTPPLSPKDMRSTSPLVLRPHISRNNNKKKRKKRKK